MAARTRPIGAPPSEFKKDFESLVSDFVENQAFQAKKQIPRPTPTTIILSDLNDGTGIYDGPTGKFFAELLPDLPDDKWFDIALLCETEVVNRFHGTKNGLMTLHAALIEYKRRESMSDKPFIISKKAV